MPGEWTKKRQAAAGACALGVWSTTCLRVAVASESDYILLPANSTHLLFPSLNPAPYNSWWQYPAETSNCLLFVTHFALLRFASLGRSPAHLFLRHLASSVLEPSSASTMDLPPLPCPVSEFVSYVNKHSQSQAGVAEAGQPFINFESKLREVYAQHPGNSAATANHLVSIFENDPVTIRARDLPSESTKEKEKYLLPLPDHLRRENGSPATVGSLKEFKTNFNLFSESSLADLDWSNVVVAGSAAVTSLLPLDAPHNESKVIAFIIVNPCAYMISESPSSLLSRKTCSSIRRRPVLIRSR